MPVPNVSVSELMEYAKRVFPADKVTHIPMNPDYGSWRLQIGGREDERWLEFVWGPQSGFGATDLKNLPKDDPDIFAPYEVALSSFEDAKRWLAQKTRQPIKTTTATTFMRTNSHMALYAQDSVSVRKSFVCARRSSADW